jgi:AAA15 family ATPase/GTPase
MLTSVRLQNFKGHTDTTVNLGKLTVLVGPNASGKTSVLKALSLMGRCLSELPQEVFSGPFKPEDVGRLGSNGAVTIDIGRAALA